MPLILFIQKIKNISFYLMYISVLLISLEVIKYQSLNLRWLLNKYREKNVIGWLNEISEIRKNSLLFYFSHNLKLKVLLGYFSYRKEYLQHFGVQNICSASSQIISKSLYWKIYCIHLLLFELSRLYNCDNKSNNNHYRHIIIKSNVQNENSSILS